MSGEKCNSKSRFKWVLIIFFIVLSMCLIPGQNAQAASKKTKALKAYSQLLSGSTLQWPVSSKDVSLSKCRFSILYLDNDSVPELLIDSNGQTILSEGTFLLYTYKNGKAQFVGMLDGSATLKYYKKKGVIIDRYTTSGGDRTSYHKFSGTKLTTKLNIAKPTANSTEKMYSNVKDGVNKQITKKKFNSKLEKLVGSTKTTKVKTYKNTKANRKKYLK